MREAEIAYEAYRAHTGGVSIITNGPIPPFDDLDPRIKAAWAAASMAVLIDSRMTQAYADRWPFRAMTPGEMKGAG